jgi:hypothetical protein
LDYFNNPVRLNEFGRKRLNDELSRHVSFVKMEDVSASLPKRMELKRYFELDASTERYYSQMAHNAVISLEKKQKIIAPHILTQRQKLRQILSGFLYQDSQVLFPETRGNRLNTGKSHLFSDLIQNEIGGKPVIVWYEYEQELLDILALIRDDFDHDIASGQNTQTAIDRFKAGEIQALISNPQSMGKGIQLGRHCSHMVFYSVSDSWERHVQAKARITAPGKTEPLRYYYLLADPGAGHRYIDAVIMNALGRKADINDATFEYFKQFKEVTT